MLFAVRVFRARKSAIGVALLSIVTNSEQFVNLADIEDNHSTRAWTSGMISTRFIRFLVHRREPESETLYSTHKAFNRLIVGKFSLYELVK
jgi:hypothetical protein